MSHIRLASLLPLLVALTACLDEEGGNPCDRYVDYMCDCHGDTTDCDQLAATYEDADQDLQDECLIALEDQEDDDAETGHECTSGSADTGA